MIVLTFKSKQWAEKGKLTDKIIINCNDHLSK